MIGIITLPHTNQYNYGGVLQNYALCTYLNQNGFEAEAIHCNTYSLGNRIRIDIYNWLNIYIDKNKGKFLIKKEKTSTITRNKAFKNFINSKIKPTKYKRYKKSTYQSINNRYDMLIVGSDQVWNPYWAVNDKTAITYFLTFFNGRKISYAASFGVKNIPDIRKEMFKKGLSNFDYISVRENEGKEIVNSLIGENIEVLIDPSMLLSREDWIKIEKKSPFRKEKPYILKYFLGTQDERVLNDIQKVAECLECDIYDVSENYESEFYTSGPGEFVDLIDHAIAIYTDSFHATVFSVIFNKPYVVFNRNQKGMNDMSSRIETFLNKFKLKRNYIEMKNGEIIFDNNFENAYEILKMEQEKAKKYLETACKM